jgi:hypothetical protein
MRTSSRRNEPLASEAVRSVLTQPPRVNELGLSWQPPAVRAFATLGKAN